MKKLYIKPDIIELEMGTMNIFAGSPNQQKANNNIKSFWENE